MQNNRLDNIHIILVGTKHPGNIGSAARAMANMGLSRLRLAAPQCEINDEAKRLAKAGAGILQKVESYSTLGEAVHDIRLLIGTTGKTGGNRSKTHTPRNLAGKILEPSGSQKTGIVFGPEDTGLVDEDLLPCQMLLRIPTHPKARSLNLAHAVMVVSYELYQAHLVEEPARGLKLASVGQVEAMYQQLERALLDVGFLHEQNSRHMMFALRRFFGRAGLQAPDVGILRGIARQVSWYGSRHRRDETSPKETSVEASDQAETGGDDGMGP
jgi:tRNA/rRNA methyltransferase